MTHYRKAGNISHCGAEILPNGKDIPYIVIERVEFHEKLTINGRANQNHFVAYFAPNPYTNLPMILNRINQITLMKLFPEIGTDIDKLRNAPVRLTSQKANNPSMGMMLPSLRISKIAANPKDAPSNTKATPTPTPTPAPQPKPGKQAFPADDKATWDYAVNFLKEGNDIAKIKAKYDISEDIEQRLIEEANNG
jgi:hypothetical protein